MRGALFTRGAFPNWPSTADRPTTRASASAKSCATGPTRRPRRTSAGWSCTSIATTFERNVFFTSALGIRASPSAFTGASERSWGRPSTSPR